MVNRKSILGNIAVLVLALALVLSGQLADAGSGSRENRPPATFEYVDETSGYVPVDDGRDVNATADVRPYVSGTSNGLVGKSRSASPGLTVAINSIDKQRNGSMHHMIEIDAQTGRVHMAWMHWGLLPVHPDDKDVMISYNMWDPGSGDFIADTTEGHHLSSEGCFGGYTSIDVGSDGKALVALHQRDSPGGVQSPYVARQFFSGTLFFGGDFLLNPTGQIQLWPRIDASDSDEPDVSDVIHVVSSDFLSTNDFAYYRGVRSSSGSIIWSPPVAPFTGTTLSAVVTEDPTDDDVALVWAKRLDDMSTSQVNNDIAYLLSTTNGSDWVAGQNLDPAGTTNITNYPDEDDCVSTYRAYTDIAAIFDRNGELHIVWNARYVECQTFYLNQCDLLHWSPGTGIVPIVVADWDPDGASGSWEMNLCKMSLGVGAAGGILQCDGSSIENSLYLVYTQFGGPTVEEQTDVATNGFNNGELYLSVSSDGGITWGDRINLTNTKTPDCDTSYNNRCASEHYISIARTVNDTAHTLYVADEDAGRASSNPEGMWTLNPMRYYRISGEQFLCPSYNARGSAALSDDPDCPYFVAPDAQRVETLTLSGSGNADWIYEISAESDTLDWLSVGGRAIGAVHVSYPPKDLTVTMDATGLPEGWYDGTITIRHNDPTQGEIVLPVQLLVDIDYDCTCQCPSMGDVSPLSGDSVINVLDVVYLIDHVFRSGPAPAQDVACPASHGDWNCDGPVNVLDVVASIDHVFRSGAGPCDPCACVLYPTDCP